MDLSQTPIPVRRALRKLGQDIRDARRRRRIPSAYFAEGRVVLTAARLLADAVIRGLTD